MFARRTVFALAILGIAGICVTPAAAKPPSKTQKGSTKPGTSTPPPKFPGGKPLPKDPPPKLPTGAGPQMPTFDNWGFERGLIGWEKTGSAFNSQPTWGDNVTADRIVDKGTRYSMALGGDYWAKTSFPIGHKGMRWIGTNERRAKQSVAVGTVQGDTTMGTLTSKPFKIEQNFITFLIGGGKDPQKLGVRLLTRVSDSAPGVHLKFPDGKYAITSKFTTGDNQELLRRKWWNVASLKGKTARIQIVDHAKGAWGHINVDDFTFQPKSPRDTVVKVGKHSFRQAHKHAFRRGDVGSVDWDAPVWGVADLHTHPAAHLGFGKKMLHGAPDGDIQKELGNCNCTHGGWGLDNTCGNHLRAMVVGMTDDIYKFKGGIENLMDHPHDGYPNFKHWPHFTTVTHQQMRIEWLKRAQQGGVRVIVALAVNNHLLAEAIDGDRPKSDKRSADIQLDYMKAFVKRNPKVLGLARDPAELRQVVRSGRMAVILGIEVDNLGNFNFIGKNTSDSAIKAEIKRLYNKGVRYIFPIHVTDNKFGGAAVTSEMFNLANRFNAVAPLPPDAGAWVPGTSYVIEHAPDPLVKYRLAPVLPGAAAMGLLSLANALEMAPSPIMGLPLATFLKNEGEYNVIKAFFLTPDPLTETYVHIKPGHRNKKGLSSKGAVAVKEMMRLGMIIDVDHASEKAVDKMLEMAEQVKGGYPLVSGHNTFRRMTSHADENKRTDAQGQRIMKLDGMLGVGYGYEKDPGHEPSFASKIGKQAWTSSKVAKTCGGSSRTFAQNYLYALEKMGMAHVALGTDVNGMVPGPGPRFGADKNRDGNRCSGQNNPVKYIGGPLRSHPILRLQRGSANELQGGNNRALRREKTGNRLWDINLDGVAHYGMVPDFFQDLKNVGLDSKDMTPLFLSAEHLARTWEKALRVAPN